MSLFQPTNIIPSTFSGLRNSVVDTSSNISISWQVNGNSPMTGYKIDILQNNAASTSVHSTGLISISSSPFYPVDEKGNPQVFTYQPLNTTWASWGLSNGNSYKVKITQYWTQSTTNDNLVEQNSLSVFNTALTPSLTVSINGSIMVAGTPSAIETAYANFTATLSESNAVIAVRWIIAANDNGTRTVLEDTGFITTSQLKYEYVGLFDNSSYSIKCMFQLANGYSSEDTAQWFDFNVEYAETYEYSGEFTSTCVSAENANLLTWEEVEAIPGIASGGYEFVSDGIELESGTTITWDTVVQGDTQTGLSFSAPWTAVIKGKVSVSFAFENTESSSTVTRRSWSSENACAISPTGSYFVSGNIICWLTNGQISSINAIPLSLSSTCASVSITNNGSKLVLNVWQAGESSDQIVIANVNSENQTVSVSTTITAPFSDKRISVSSDGNWLCAFAASTAWDANIKLYKIGTSSLTEYNISANSLIDYSTSFSAKFISTAIGELFLLNKYLFKVSDLTDGTYEAKGNSWEVWQTLQNASDPCWRNSLSPDGKYLAYMDNSNVHFAIFNNNTVEYLSSFNNPASTSNDILQFINNTSLFLTHKYSATSIEETVLCVSSAKLANEKYYVVKSDKFTTYSDNYYYGLQSMGYGNRAYIPRTVGSGDGFSCNVFKLDFIPQGQITQIGNVSITANTSAASNNGFIAFLTTIINYNSAMGQYVLVISPTGWILAEYLTDYGNRIRGEVVETGYLSYTQSAITSIVLGSVAQTAREISVYQGEVGDNMDLYTDYNFIPRFGAEDYILYFSARFNGDLEGGTGTSNGTGFQLYRNEVGSNSLFLLATLDANITQLKDYTAKSQTAYEYSLFVFDHNGAFMDKVELASSVCTKYRSFMLYETTPDNTLPNVFHVLNVWKFGNNVNGGSYTNNNNPQWQKNFTKYPLKQPTTELYQSGTLTALLSNVKNYAYADTAEQMERLSNISASTNTFFLKDTKGNLFMVGIGGAITQTINTKTGVQEVTVSIPWKEVGDASNVSVVSIPTDDGWSN